MTFTIVGFNETAVGIATASRWVAVGSLVPWVDATGVAVATQAFTDKSYGPLGIKGLSDGRFAGEMLTELLGEDVGSDYRQLIFLDLKGEFACHTGRGALQHSTHFVGQHAAAAGNMLAHPQAPQRMVEAFHEQEGDLAAKLLAALTAGEEAGGDVRGKQAAALRIEPRTLTPMPEESDFGVDLRVDDHVDPIPELRRLYQVQIDSTQVAQAMFPGSRTKRNGRELAMEFVIQHETTSSTAHPELWRSLILLMENDPVAAKQALKGDLRMWPVVQGWAAQLTHTGLRWV